MKTRVISRTVIAATAATFALWSAPVSMHALVGFGAPAEASAEIGTPCGPSIDGAIIFDGGVGYECRALGNGKWGWVPIA